MYSAFSLPYCLLTVGPHFHRLFRSIYLFSHSQNFHICRYIDCCRFCCCCCLLAYAEKPFSLLSCTMSSVTVCIRTFMHVGKVAFGRFLHLFLCLCCSSTSHFSTFSAVCLLSVYMRTAIAPHRKAHWKSLYSAAHSKNISQKTPRLSDETHKNGITQAKFLYCCCCCCTFVRRCVVVHIYIQIHRYVESKRERERERYRFERKHNFPFTMWITLYSRWRCVVLVVVTVGW